MSFIDTMKKYYVSTILVGIVVFVYFLYIVNVGLSWTNTSTSIPFPPWVSSCPDYWSNVGSTKCKQSQPNGKQTCTFSTSDGKTSLGYDVTSDTTSSVDFKDVSAKDKCNWAQKCGVYWEGISDQICSNLEIPSTTST